ncbi:hypothetical protein ASE36_02325 [Rhizobium sp. Root274]|nr:hypothetical protein ASC71_02320 [Rhizobium sp. Root1240]KRD32688.1 hypothetical protein ASE36_02325 [Rhizobium sp. Root274]
MRRAGGRGHAPVALEETGLVLGEMLRRALAQRLAAQAVRRTDAPEPEEWQAIDDGGERGLVLRSPDVSGASG